MLTKFEYMDTLKMKFTVIVIWMIAIAITMGMFLLLKENTAPLWIRVVIGVVSALSILAILLRCKVGRWFTLLGIYTFILLPIMISLIPIFLLPDQKVIPIDMQHALIHFLIGFTAVYFMSNKEAMDIFYIRPKPLEHIVFILLGTVLIASYIYLTNNIVL